MFLEGKVYRYAPSGSLYVTKNIRKMESGLRVDLYTEGGVLSVPDYYCPTDWLYKWQPKFISKLRLISKTRIKV